MLMLKQYLLAFLILFFACDILPNFAVLFHLTETLNQRQKTKIIREAIAFLFIWGLILIIGGYFLLPFCGLTMFDIMGGGGVVLVALSLFSLLTHDSSRYLSIKKQPHDFGKAIPIVILISGPSLVVATFISPGFIDILTVIFAFFLNCLLAWLLLKKLHSIEKFIGKRTISYFAKIHKIVALMLGIMIIRLAFAQL